MCTGPQDVTYDEYGRKNRIHLYSKKSSEDLKKKMNALKRYFQVVINSALEKPRSCQQIKLTFKQIVCEATKEQLLPANAMQTICEDILLPKYKATKIIFLGQNLDMFYRLSQKQRNPWFFKQFRCFSLLRHRGFEPRTTWLKVKCSTDWANTPYKIFQTKNAQNRNRTSDTRIFSPLLYQLSYLGMSFMQTFVIRCARSRPLVFRFTAFAV